MKDVEVQVNIFDIQGTTQTQTISIIRGFQRKRTVASWPCQMSEQVGGSGLAGSRDPHSASKTKPIVRE